MVPVPPSAAPERLTAMLRGAGVLERGRVVDVAVESSRETLISRITRLRLTYDDAGAGPSHVFWKSQRETSDPRQQDFGRKEVDFYRLVAAPANLLPRCYEARAEPTEPWHLALEDLTASHQTLGEWPLPPSIERLHAVLEAHAIFHGAWWDHPRLGVSVGTFVDQSGAFDTHLAAMPADLAAFADRLGDRLSTERKQRYERLIATAPRLHCFPDWRRRYERDSLRRYHDTLVGHGVRGYSFEALWQDYRLSVLWQITTPMWQANHGLPPWIWWNHLERVMRAVDDLDCLELLA